MTIDYNIITARSQRFIIKEALKLIDTECHLYIAFYTQTMGTVISTALRKKYPKKMAIILQHEFYNLTVHNNNFSVELRFNNLLEMITIPFNGIEIFHDKNNDFYLKLNTLTAPHNLSGSIKPTDDSNKIIKINDFFKNN